MSGVSEVLLRILGDPTGGVAALKTVQGEAAKTSASIKAAGDESEASSAKIAASFEAAGATISSVGKTMTMGLTLPIVAGLAVAVKSSMDFQSAMVKIQTQAGASSDEVKNMSKAILDMGGKVEQTPKDLAQGLYWIESAGYRGAAALDVLKSSSDLAAVGQTDLGQTANALVSVMKAMPGQFKDATDAASQMNAIIGNGKMTMDDLNAAVGTGFLSSASMFGVSLQSVGAALDSMTAAGYPAQKAATGLAMGMTLMAAPTSKASAILGALGVAQDEVQGSTQAMTDALAASGVTQSQLATDLRQPDGLVVAITDLKDHLEKASMNATAAGDIIAKIFGGGRTAKPIELMVNDTAGLTKAFDDAGASASNFGADVKSESETAQAHWNEFKSGLMKDLILLGNTALPQVTSAFASLGDKIQDISSWYEHLSPHEQDMVVKGLEITAALGPGLYILGKMVSLWGPLITGIQTSISWLGQLAAAWQGVGASADTAAAEEAVAGAGGAGAGAGAGGVAAAGGEAGFIGAGMTTELGASGLAGVAGMGLGGSIVASAAIAAPIIASAYGLFRGAQALGLFQGQSFLGGDEKIGKETDLAQQIQKDYESKSYGSWKQHLDEMSALTGQHYATDEKAIKDHFGAALVDQTDAADQDKAIQDAINSGDLNALKKALDDKLSAQGIAGEVELKLLKIINDKASTAQQVYDAELQLDAKRHEDQINKIVADAGATRKKYKDQELALAAQAQQQADAGDIAASTKTYQQLHQIMVQEQGWELTQQKQHLAAVLTEYNANTGKFTAAGQALANAFGIGLDDPNVLAAAAKQAHDYIAGQLRADFGVGSTASNDKIQGDIMSASLGAGSTYGLSIPGYATGGMVGLNGPEVVLTGEAGPEYIVPNHMLSAYGLGEEAGMAQIPFLAALARKSMMSSFGGSAVGLGKMLAAAVGWTGGEWDALYNLWQRESGWNPNAVNPSSGAYGIPQSLGHGHPYNLGDAAAQIAWGINYIEGRYGDAATAWQHEVDYGWYASGGSFVADRPGIFHAGEAGKERVDITPLDSSSGSGIHLSGTFNFYGVTDIKALAQELGRLSTTHRGAAAQVGAF